MRLFSRRFLLVYLFLSVSTWLLITGCRLPSGDRQHTFITTAYCSCSQCCGWERGSIKYLKLDFWNRYVAQGSAAGKRYSGRTASGVRPRTVQPGLFSFDTLSNPWMVLPRAVIPWFILPRPGTIAADTNYYPFGTKIYVPGYGWGIVQDRGGGIKGPDRLDLYFRTHREARQWGRKKVVAEIRKP